MKRVKVLFYAGARAATSRLPKCDTKPQTEERRNKATCGPPDALLKALARRRREPKREGKLHAWLKQVAALTGSETVKPEAGPENRMNAGFTRTGKNGYSGISVYKRESRWKFEKQAGLAKNRVRLFFYEYRS